MLNKMIVVSLCTDKDVVGAFSLKDNSHSKAEWTFPLMSL